MALEKIEQVKGRGICIPGDDIDTDRIIPARFMKCVTFDGLGEFVFYDVRKNEDGSDKPHPLNDPRFAGATILFSGSNFGCGSSREHAPQALHSYGFRAIVAESFAEIFFGNSTTLGIPCISASRDDIRKIAAILDKIPETEVTVDVASATVTAGDLTIQGELRHSAKNSLLEGRWDQIAELMEDPAKVDATAARLPYIVEKAV